MNGKPDAKKDFAILGRIQRDGTGWREKVGPNDDTTSNPNPNPNPEEVAVNLVIGRLTTTRGDDEPLSSGGQGGRIRLAPV